MPKPCHKHTLSEISVEKAARVCRASCWGTPPSALPPSLGQGPALRKPLRRLNRY
ncbi:hypothetical protein M407DRAFT_245133 [Tulasnella calospora MUT 4182]|uniref:Uncharacterized protein n=1 Tax=Tulasnella calospora MUT 4182 TaxID=1051891 RepID=A0A0C3KM99_9AGAM|nr:hypothetical protein M407DRAFT_245133 [Tulasnella calospora MUT 4182]